MNLGEYEKTEEFPEVAPERVEPVVIPEQAPIKINEPAEIPNREKQSV
jgi:hypothetical protein